MRSSALSGSLGMDFGGAVVGLCSRTGKDEGPLVLKTRTCVSVLTSSCKSCLVSPGFAYTVRNEVMVLLRKMCSGALP